MHYTSPPLPITSTFQSSNSPTPIATSTSIIVMHVVKMVTAWVSSLNSPSAKLNICPKVNNQHRNTTILGDVLPKHSITKALPSLFILRSSFGCVRNQIRQIL